MSKYSQGERVETTGTPERKGSIVSFETEAGGREYYKVHLDGDRSARILSDNEIRPLVTS